MKAQRRHELEKNYLADWLAGVIERVKPYQKAIWAAVILVMVLMVGLSWWSHRLAGKESDASDRFFAAMESGQLDPADFEDIAAQYAGTTVAQWALVMAGDLRLASGCNAILENKATANQDLRGAGEQPGAIDHYLAVLNEARDPMLRQRTLFGLARAYEAVGELPEAEKRYKELTDQWPDGTYAVAAVRRMKDLQRPSIEGLYDKLANYNPKPAFSEEPGLPGERSPFELGTVPDGPLYQPKIGPAVEGLQQKAPGEAQPKTETPKADAPAASPDAKSGGSADAPAQPAAAAPEAPAAPGAEASKTPAPETPAPKPEEKGPSKADTPSAPPKEEPAKAPEPKSP